MINCMNDNRIDTTTPSAYTFSLHSAIFMHLQYEQRAHTGVVLITMRVYLVLATCTRARLQFRMRLVLDLQYYRV